MVQEGGPGRRQRDPGPHHRGQLQGQDGRGGDQALQDQPHNLRRHAQGGHQGDLILNIFIYSIHKVLFIADFRFCNVFEKMQKWLVLLDKQDIFPVMLKVFIVSGHSDEKADL